SALLPSRHAGARRPDLSSYRRARRLANYSTSEAGMPEQLNIRQPAASLQTHTCISTASHATWFLHSQSPEFVAGDAALAASERLDAGTGSSRAPLQRSTHARTSPIDL